MAEEIVKRRKKRFEVELPSTLLLTNIYFLNPIQNKYILIGYSAAKDFKPVIVFCHESSYVEFILSDWSILTKSCILINDWFTKTDINDGLFITTKNIGIKKILKANNTYIQIQNIHHTRQNNNIILNVNEYRKCIEIDLFIQNIWKCFQNNWCGVEDYYNMYVHKCNTKNKLVLDDFEYFFFDSSVGFDCYRLFKEISLFCVDKLQSDVMFSPTNTNNII